MLVGIHSPTKVKKSWHFEAYGERMKEFVNFSATGKKMKTDMKLLSDSWFIGNFLCCIFILMDKTLLNNLDYNWH